MTNFTNLTNPQNPKNAPNNPPYIDEIHVRDMETRKDIKAVEMSKENINAAIKDINALEKEFLEIVKKLDDRPKDYNAHLGKMIVEQDIIRNNALIALFSFFVIMYMFLDDVLLIGINLLISMLMVIYIGRVDKDRILECKRTDMALNNYVRLFKLYCLKLLIKENDIEVKRNIYKNFINLYKGDGDKVFWDINGEISCICKECEKYRNGIEPVEKCDILRCKRQG